MTGNYTDAFGSPIAVGDIVGTRTTGGRYSGTYAGTIIKLGKGQVKIRISHAPDSFSPNDHLGREMWVLCPCAIKTVPPTPEES